MNAMDEVIKNAYKECYKDTSVDEESASFYIFQSAWLMATQKAALMLKDVGEQSPNFHVMAWLNETAINLLDGKYHEKVKPPRVDGSHGVS